MSWTKNTEARRSDFFNKFFCCSIAQFIYIGFRCRKPNLKSVTLLKVVWKFYHKGCLIIHYNVRRHSGQTVVDSQDAAEWTICFFLPRHQRQTKRFFQFVAIAWRVDATTANWPIRLRHYSPLWLKKNETIKKTFTWSPIRPCAMQCPLPHSSAVNWRSFSTVPL